jgi:hypothetical protein
VLAEVVNGKDIGVVECGRGLGFLLETAETIGIAGEGSGKDFDGDIAVQTRVPGAINLAHAACTQRRDDLVGTELRASRQSHLEVDYSVPGVSHRNCRDC